MPRSVVLPIAEALLDVHEFYVPKIHGHTQSWIHLDLLGIDRHGRDLAVDGDRLLAPVRERPQLGHLAAGLLEHRAHRFPIFRFRKRIGLHAGDGGRGTGPPFGRVRGFGLDLEREE